MNRIIQVVAIFGIAIIASPSALAVCKKGPDLPKCARYKIVPNGSYVEIENNCPNELKVHINKKKKGMTSFCPDKDAKIGPGQTWSEDSSHCRFVEVRLCR